MRQEVALRGEVLPELSSLAAEANHRHAECEAAYGTALEHAWYAGRALTDAKAQLKHGEWLPWLEENFKGGHATASNYMKVAAANFQRVRNLAEEGASLRSGLKELSSNGDVHFSSERHDWATPQELFNVLNQEFDFELDVCATAETAKCKAFFSVDDDGLSKPWSGTCFMNPPYGGEIGKWVQKAWNASCAGARVVCLVPARVDTEWWWDYCRHGEVRFLKGRLKFDNAENSAPFPSAVVIFDQGTKTATRYWEWQ